MVRTIWINLVKSQYSRNFGVAMNPQDIMQKMQTIANDMQTKVGDAIRQSPAKDVEKNVRSLMTQGFQKLDLVTREEFDLQTQVLAKTRAKLEALEAKVSALESKSK
jgi:BMFP domain-containing protein YqiC